ncbi:RNA polymerase sigma factor [Promicromonospora xylanilytica]
MPIDPAAFRTAWPQVVRSLAVATRSLDSGEEYAAEAFARAAAQPDGVIEDLVGWCVQVGRRTWLDAVRHQAVFRRIQPQLARPEVVATDTPTAPGDDLDDRLALLFVACDDALASGAQLVLAMRVVCGLTIRQIAGHLGIADATAAARLTRAKTSLARARGEFAVPDGAARDARLPVVLACVAGLFTVGQRDAPAPTDVTQDPARDALTLAEALVAQYPDDPEALGLRAVCRLGLARRPGRVRDGVALPLDEVDRSAWDQRLLSAGLADATAAIARTRSPRTPGRFALEAAISGVHATTIDAEDTDWARLAQLYDALLRTWPSPATRVARLVVLGRLAMRDGGDLGPVERELEELVADGPAYAARDASLALADLARRTGRTDDAAARYRELLDVLPAGPLREFCRRHAG